MEGKLRHGSLPQAGMHKPPEKCYPRPALAIALPLRVGYELLLIIENLFLKADSAQGIAG